MYFFVFRDHEVVMKAVQIEIVFQRGELIPKVSIRSIMYFLETVILDYRSLRVGYIPDEGTADVLRVAN